MKFLKLLKDGGDESRVWGYFLAEVKSLFSVVLLNFKDGSREAYHTHAFHAISWVLRGRLLEDELREGNWRSKFVREYLPSFKPIITPRSMFHKVTSDGDTWVLSFRGPWVDHWKEFLPQTNETVALTHGREVVAVMKDGILA